MSSHFTLFDLKNPPPFAVWETIFALFDKIDYFAIHTANTAERGDLYHAVG